VKAAGWRIVQRALVQSEKKNHGNGTGEAVAIAINNVKTRVEEECCLVGCSN